MLIPSKLYYTIYYKIAEKSSNYSHYDFMLAIVIVQAVENGFS